jgi:PHD-finger
MSRKASTNKSKEGKPDEIVQIAAAAKSGEKCDDCGKFVLDQDKGLQCEACEAWFHASCQGMNEDTYKIVGQTCIHWFCKTCDKAVSKLFKTIANIKVRQDKMEQTLDKAVEDIMTVKADIIQMSSFSKELDTKLETIIEAKLVESVEELKKNKESEPVLVAGLKRDEVLEEIEIEKRRLNLVIMGIKEDDEDETAVKDLFTVLVGSKGVKAVTSVERIGRVTAGKTRPIRVKMANSDSKLDVLKASSDLRKHEEYKKVYISPDLTRKQQEADKLIRDKLKEMRNGGETDIRIKKGKIIKNSNGVEVVMFSPLPN